MKKSDTIKVSIRANLRSTEEYGHDVPSEAEFEVSVDRGHDVLMALFSESLRSVTDRLQSEKVHRDATARLAAAATAVPVGPAPEDEEVDAETVDDSSDDLPDDDASETEAVDV